MAQQSNIRLAQLFALGIPVVLLGGAYISELGFGLFPCEMCWWQRWPHIAAIPLALLALLAAPKQLWLTLAALALLTSGLIGGFHAGVEYGWWEGITSCATASPQANVMSFDEAPLIRCDIAPWTLFGISLAGWNFLFSTLGAITILGLLRKQERA